LCRICTALSKKSALDAEPTKAMAATYGGVAGGTVIQAGPPSHQVSELVLVAPKPEKHVVWDEESAVDNEHMGKKSSKKCCQFHRRRRFDETSSESSADDERGDSCGKHCSHGKEGGPEAAPTPGEAPHNDEKD
jgi:protein phosphatase 1 regulatory subunit 11